MGSITGPIVLVSYITSYQKQEVSRLIVFVSLANAVEGIGLLKITLNWFVKQHQVHQTMMY
jgi:hypothetical protein